MTSFAIILIIFGSTILITESIREKKLFPILGALFLVVGLIVAFSQESTYDMGAIDHAKGIVVIDTLSNGTLIVTEKSR